MKKILCVLPLLLAACAPPQPAPESQARLDARAEYRRAVFNECLAAVPKGPTSVHENGDWEGVVAACTRHAYYITNERYR